MVEKAKTSRALQINLADYKVEVTIDPKYQPIKEVMAKYHGLQDGITTYLKELCHPYKNRQFIIKETWTYCLAHFYDLTVHPHGQEAAALYVDVIMDVLTNAKDYSVRSDAYSLFYLFTQKLIRDSGDALPRFFGVISHGLRQIDNLPDELFIIVAKSYYQINKLARHFLGTVTKVTAPADTAAELETALQVFNALLIHFLRYTYDYWLTEKEPKDWLAQEAGQELPPEIIEMFEPISLDKFRSYQGSLNEIIAGKDADPGNTLRTLIDLPGYGDITAIFNDIPPKISRAAVDEKIKYNYEIMFLFHIMNTPGLSNIHEEAIREINRIIKLMINRQDFEHNKALIKKTLEILKGSLQRYPSTVLRCVLNMGKGVYESNDSDLINFLSYGVDPLGFQSPDFRGINNDWQIQSNAAHIENIRTWMELIRLNPVSSKKLLSSLIIHLSLCGVLIKDTDLFPRNITDFLNAPISPVYNLVKQLMRLFPTYFNELGAEGLLRDISTRMDDACKRNDALIHFLRKQSHVESSNKITSLAEATLEFWRTCDKEVLKPYLPPDIYNQVQTTGPLIDGLHVALKHMFDTKGLTRVSDLLRFQEDYFGELLREVGDTYAADVEKVALTISFYRLLDQKYSAGFNDIESYISQIHSTVFPDSTVLLRALSGEHKASKLSAILTYLLQLKELILSDQVYEVREDIYRKRHISTEIPSMYGSYHETKFDALGLTFRLESLVNVLFDELIAEFDFKLITRTVLNKIHEYLKLYKQALSVDAIPLREFDKQLYLLESALRIRGFTFTQFLDIFKGFSQVVRNIVNDNFNNIHKENLKVIIEHTPQESLLPKYLATAGNSSTPVQKKDMQHRVSEIFLRDTIAMSLGLQSLDMFITKILNTLHTEAEYIPEDKHHLLINYNPVKAVCSITNPTGNISDIIHLGNKGFNLMRMKTLGLPIPPGFIITTDVFKTRELFDLYQPANRQFRERVDLELANLERLTGRSFGNPDNPLLVSVRSGSAISQPGMLDSYLNVGINEAVAYGLIKQTGNEWFVWDCYRRFLQHYGMSFGIERDGFDIIINDYKNRCGVALKKDLTARQMKEIAFAYEARVIAGGVVIEESPREQLYVAIRKVFDSWDTEKAKVYRRIIGISDDWGTSVTVQLMVYGNISGNSGSGVFFTHSPRVSQYLLRPCGDYATSVQGDDVVAGLVQTWPISALQAITEDRPVEMSLERRYPVVYKRLVDVAHKLIYDRQWNPQDIEFTFEAPTVDDTYILQSRDMEISERQGLNAFALTPESARKLLGHGIGVSGGALSGRIVFSMTDIERFRKLEPQTSLILVRRDTVPDDIREVSATDALLTARGGATSHASIVAGRLGKTCVVGCADMICMEHEGRMTLKGRTMSAGDIISIDGYSGAIYDGPIEIIEVEGV
ncbi:protein containing Pyruvate phosphate dikinase, PEP/pyruvate-binding [Candidatus Magnetobacterium bavaricum]|uniref:Protein containing Pyruvate phosphate dikinase, PEP/pyruvate-binding n=1 Tax=Candidatus Magnetobacterium bavaricum TaxID=29290 RepID=A0A0F3GN63_9BACT|nr:protein containing Pyruvate phosphate dikinase, PEP/pyruvate-binding [Candidatus Magnetobacterium bavaricum]